MLEFKQGEDKIPAYILLYRLFKMLKAQKTIQNLKNKNQDNLTELQRTLKIL